jgi:hypothetical protein
VKNAKIHIGKSWMIWRICKQRKFMIVNRINAYISGTPTFSEELKAEVAQMAGDCFARQFMEERKDEPKNLRLSSAGKCARSLAYDYLGFEQSGKSIDARGRMVFWLGDCVETTVICLAKLSGIKILNTGKDQIKVDLKITDEVEISGHPDGIVEHEGEKFLLEVKSMTSYGFSEFERGIINETYLCQVDSYMEALGLDKCVFVAINKESGVLGEKILTKNKERVEFVKNNIRAVLKSTKEELPKRPYEPNEKGFYPWMCSYCGSYKTCLIDTGLAERVVVKNSYKLKALKAESK